MKIKFSGHISKNTQVLNFMKIRSVGAELFNGDRRADKRTDGRHDEANSRFSQICERASFLRMMKESTSKAVSILKPEVCVPCALSGCNQKSVVCLSSVLFVWVRFWKIQL
jgi:hypothetical protein